MISMLRKKRVQCGFEPGSRVYAACAPLQMHKNTNLAKMKVKMMELNSELMKFNMHYVLVLNFVCSMLYS